MWKAVRICLGLAVLAKGIEMLGAVAKGGASYSAAFGGSLFAFAVLITGACSVEIGAPRPLSADAR